MKGIMSEIARERLVLMALSAALLTSGACASVGRATFKEPVVLLREVTITGIGISGGTVDVILSVYNPNSYRLDALSLTYRVDIDSVQLGDGQLGERFVVQKGDSTEVRLPVNFTYVGIGVAGRKLLQSGSVNYRVRGDFTVSTPIGNFKRPYDQSGRYTTLGGDRR